MKSAWTMTAVAVVGMAALGGCKDRPKKDDQGVTKYGVQRERVKIGGVGELRLKGPVSDLRVLPGGNIATVLLDGEKPRLDGVPPQVRIGELWAVPLKGGEPRKLANGATNMPGGSLFSKDGRWIFFLAGFNITAHVGELFAQDLNDLAGEKQRISGQVAYYVPSPDGSQLAFVEDGILRVGPVPLGPFRQVAGEVATATFSSNGTDLYFRRKSAAGGGLFQATLSDAVRPPRRLTDQVGDYSVSDDGRSVLYLARSAPGVSTFDLFLADAATLKSRPIAQNVLSMGFSPTGQWLAWIQGEVSVGQQAMFAGGQRLDVGSLYVAPRAGGAPKKLGEDVRDYAFMSNDERIVFRQKYIELSLEGINTERLGELVLMTLKDGEKKVLEKRAPNFVVAPDGKTLAFTGATRKPEFTRYLFLLPDGAKEATRLKDWIYEYGFSPDSKHLYFRADCTREGRACWLMSSSVEKPTEAIERVADAIFSFALSADSKRVLLTYAHTEADTFDASVLNLSSKVRKTLEQNVGLPLFFVADDGGRVVYTAKDKKRQGLHVATEVP